MQRILITGMSGTGKSAAIRELAARGHAAHDLDTPEWSEWIDADPSDGLTPLPGKDWVWREDWVRDLLAGWTKGPLFIAGCAGNMARLYPSVERIVLLSAPVDTILARLKARSPGGYGHAAEERRKVLALIATVEPLLRQSAHREIDTRQPLRATVDEILRIGGDLP